MAMAKDVAKEAKAGDEKVLEGDDARESCEGNIHGMPMKQSDSNQGQGKKDELGADAEQDRRRMGFRSKNVRGQKDDPCNEKKSTDKVAEAR